MQCMGHHGAVARVSHQVWGGPEPAVPSATEISPGSSTVLFVEMKGLRREQQMPPPPNLKLSGS